MFWNQMQTKTDAGVFLPPSELRSYCGLCKPRSSELYYGPGASWSFPERQKGKAELVKAAGTVCGSEWDPIGVCGTGSHADDLNPLRETSSCPSCCPKTRLSFRRLLWVSWGHTGIRVRRHTGALKYRRVSTATGVLGRAVKWNSTAQQRPPKSQPCLLWAPTASWLLTFGIWNLWSGPCERV